MIGAEFELMILE